MREEAKGNELIYVKVSTEILDSLRKISTNVMRCGRCPRQDSTMALSVGGRSASLQHVQYGNLASASLNTE